MDNYGVTYITTDGYDGKVPNSYWFCGSDTLLVMLPGLGYTNQMPIMFYLRKLAVNHGYDLLEVDYDYRAVPRETTAADWNARFIADVEPMLKAAIARGGYKKVVLAGKSIGTRVMASLLDSGFSGNIAHIWLTPLLISPPVYDAVKNSKPSVAVFGDADYAVQNADLATLSQAGVKMIIMPGGDHSMDLPGDVPQSIAALSQVMLELNGWLTANVDEVSV